MEFRCNGKRCLFAYVSVNFESHSTDMKVLLQIANRISSNLVIERVKYFV